MPTKGDPFGASKKIESFGKLSSSAPSHSNRFTKTSCPFDSWGQAATRQSTPNPMTSVRTRVNVMAASVGQASERRSILVDSDAPAPSLQPLLPPVEGV